MAIAQITNGPSKFDLLLALFDQKTHRAVGFCAGEMRVWRVFITGVKCSPNEDEAWIIEGTIEMDFDPMSADSLRTANAKLMDSKANATPSRKFQCNFSTQTRKGMFEELPRVA